MAIQHYIGKDVYNQMIDEEKDNVQEFLSLEKGLRLEKSARIYGENLVNTKVVGMVVNKMGEQQNNIIKLEGEKEILIEENNALKKDLRDLNHYDSKKYDEMRRKHNNNKLALKGNKNNIEMGLKVLRDLFPKKINGE